ncbi:MAG: ATP-dependent zinc metalloprotease FtsH [Planctomycetes bacterium]|nr:ATP-dependent zinc metalloprotease FtsH [Planctomycetota bacterium]
MNGFDDPNEPEIDFDYLVALVDEGAVQHAVLESDRVRLTFKQETALRPEGGAEQAGEAVRAQKAFARFPQSSDGRDFLLPRLVEKGVAFRFVTDSPLTGMLLAWFLPLGIIVVVWIFLMRSMGRTQSVFSFGKSRARVVPEDDIDTKFEDVAGIEEAKQELQEIVDYLKRPGRYATLGGRIPKGVLLVGPPGCGKTLIARALAGEAGVPFFTISGSDFVEMFVGVGASRVRDLFSQAKAKAPCIVFIDELDAVGRLRGAGIGGGHDEREQTLNQLLVEMDGFETEKGTIILAATNRPDVLDPALLRPGRFDRRIVIDRPDKKGRMAILEVHARKKPLGADVDLEELARRTPGFSGADLANAMNEAALLAARRDKDRIEREDLMEAVERVLTGPERRSRVINEREKLILAYHEMGHALAAVHCRYADPVQKVSIIPRGANALGYTLIVPEEDRYIMLREELLDRITGLLGGRAAEKAVFNTISTGAADDLERASDLARRMVLRFGMHDETGPVTYGRPEREVFLGRDFSYEKNFSEQTAVEIDEAVMEILSGCMKAAVAIIEGNRAVLDRLAEELRKKEVVEGSEIRAIVAEMAGLPEEERRRARTLVLPDNGQGIPAIPDARGTPVARGGAP